MDRIRKDISILKRIIKYCQEVEQAHKDFDDAYETFQNNVHYFKSVAMSLLQIGELANHLSKKFQEKYTKISYSQIISLRNIIVHGYGELKTESMWKISHENTRELQKHCEEILVEEGAAGNGSG